MLIDKLFISKSIQLLALFFLTHSRSPKFSVVMFCASLVKVRLAKLNKCLAGQGSSCHPAQVGINALTQLNDIMFIQVY